MKAQFNFQLRYRNDKRKWEDYFFNSYFSHLMYGHNPIRGNCVNLWKELIETGNKFPNKELKKSNKTLKNLLK